MLNSDAMLKALKEAFNTRQLYMVYQPVLDLRNRQIDGFEALMRWKSPEMGMVSPDIFISLLEKHGQMLPVEKMVSVSPWQTAAAWPENISLSINFSALEFCDPALPGRVRKNLSDSGLSPGRCEIEVTETLPLRDCQITARNIAELKSMGIKLALDDFGTGYANFDYLLRYAFDTLKIDKAFVAEIESGSRPEKIVEGMINLAHNFGIAVLAEGVEKKEQLELLTHMGCDKAQGFYISHPVMPHEVNDLLKQYNL